MLKKNTTFFILTIFFSTACMAQSKEQKEVAASVALLCKAMINADSLTLSKLANDSLSYGHSGGNVQNKPQFIHSFTSKASVFVTIDIQDQTIQVVGNTAIVPKLEFKLITIDLCFKCNWLKIN